jgi:hypothetical protein
VCVTGRALALTALLLAGMLLLRGAARQSARSVQHVLASVDAVPTLRGIGRPSASVSASSRAVARAASRAASQGPCRCVGLHVRLPLLGGGDGRRWASSWTTLGLDPHNADAAAVKRAYFEAARSCHPDLNGSTPENVQRFQELSLAVDDILRELAGDADEEGGAATSDASPTDGAATASRDDPDFASSFFEFINREMSDTTRAEIKAAVSTQHADSKSHRCSAQPYVATTMCILQHSITLDPRLWLCACLSVVVCLAGCADHAGADGWRRSRQRRLVGGCTTDGARHRGRRGGRETSCRAETACGWC